MALTRDFKETIQERARRDAAFREALFKEAVDAMLSGDVETGKTAPMRNNAWRERWFIESVLNSTRMQPSSQRHDATSSTWPPCSLQSYARDTNPGPSDFNVSIIEIYIAESGAADYLARLQ